METISWDQLSEWLDFTSEEPIGEEREDLRFGALSTVIWNTNLDTKKMGGMIKAHRYLVGWGRDKEHVFSLKPREKANLSEEEVDNTLNNPSRWADFKANMKAYAKSKMGG